MVVFEIFLGILGGIVGGMGMGGGTLTVPLLSLFLHYEQLRAQGINLIAFLPMSIVALFIHFKNKLVDFKNTWKLSLVGCIFSLIGALLANHLSNVVLRKLFALFLIGLGVWQLVELVKTVKEKKQK